MGRLSLCLTRQICDPNSIQKRMVGFSHSWIGGLHPGLWTQDFQVNDRVPVSLCNCIYVNSKGKHTFNVLEMSKSSSYSYAFVPVIIILSSDLKISMKLCMCISEIVSQIQSYPYSELRPHGSLSTHMSLHSNRTSTQTRSEHSKYFSWSQKFHVSGISGLKWFSSLKVHSHEKLAWIPRDSEPRLVSGELFTIRIKPIASLEYQPER